MTNFNGYIKIKEAANILGVSVMTLQRWDAKGKLIPKRHPINNYRLYERQQLQALLDHLTQNNSLLERSKR